MIATLPVLDTPRRRQVRNCGPCQECCSGFGLLAKPGWWDENKPRNTPCRFQCAAGCSIHDQPRPDICTQFTCHYVEGNIPWRPDQCGVIISDANSEALARLCNLDDVPLPMLQIFESRPRALLDLDPAQLRYYLGKRALLPFRSCFVIPSYIDMAFRGIGNGDFVRIVPPLIIIGRVDHTEADRAYADQIADHLDL
jgi:hypothetical protein